MSDLCGRNAPAPGQKHRVSLTPARAILKGKAEQLTEIEALAAKIEPALAKALSKYIDAFADGVDLQAVIAALTAGDGNAVPAMLAGVSTALEAGAVTTALQDAVWAGGALAALQVNTSVTRTAFLFNRLNSALVRFQQDYSLMLIFTQS